MTPLKHLGMYAPRNKEVSGSRSTWARFFLLRPSDLRLDSPLNGCQDPGRGNDGPLLPLLVRRGELPGQGIRLDVFETRAVGQGEVKPAEEEGPSGLARVKVFRNLEVLQVLVVGPEQECMLGTLQPVPPLLEGHLDGQQLPITDVVPRLCGTQPMGVEGAGVDLAIRRPLRNNGPYSHL